MLLLQVLALVIYISQDESLVVGYLNRILKRVNYRKTSSILNLDQFFKSDFSNFPTSSNPTELPLSFEDACEKAAKTTIECFNSGLLRCRIDFDTSIGDMTFTSLKNTLPMVKQLVTVLSTEYGLVSSILSSSSTNSSESETVDIQKAFYEEINNILSKGSIRIFFPDMGAAALQRREWKMGTAVSEVPHCVQTSNIQNDPVSINDKAVLILCPLYSEVDFVTRVLNACSELNIPCVVINPDLINMDQGFGVRARLIRNTILNTLTTTYKLKTWPAGAVVRQWPAGFSVWSEDASSDGGYSLLSTYESDPPRDLVQDLFDVSKKHVFDFNSRIHALILELMFSLLFLRYPSILYMTFKIFLPYKVFRRLQQAANPATSKPQSDVAGPNAALNLVSGVTSFFKGLSRL